MTVTPETIVADFDRLRECATVILTLRRRGWDKIASLLRWEVNPPDAHAIHNVGRTCVLASSSRGGTSVTAELLQWQGAECVDPSRRLLTLPGEEKPHLILAGLAYPMRTEQFDDLDESDAREEAVRTLLSEMVSEVGYPMSRCDDLPLYATQLYRRLLLQWPIELSELDMESAILMLSQSLRTRFHQGYCDDLANRRQVLAACVESFPFIRPSFYDCWPTLADEDAVFSGRCWSIEETPFVLPPPWCNASGPDLENGCLLLRDPSNAWRLPFWRAVFPKQEMQILHLVRDPRESVQGLCDAWGYPFGFQTMPSDFPMDIPGYTDAADSTGNEWKRYRLNFSINRSLRTDLANQKLSLVEVCAQQWRDSHQNIMADAKRLRLPRSIVRFSDLRERPIPTFTQICEIACIEASRSGLKYAESFSDRWVMATAANHVSHERWKSSPFSGEINALVAAGFFDAVNGNLGFGRLERLPIDDLPKVIERYRRAAS